MAQGLPSIFTGLPGYEQPRTEPAEDPFALPLGGRPPVPTEQPVGSSGLQAMMDAIEIDLAPTFERSLPGEAASSFLRGAVPGAIETTGQALRGVGLERAGQALKSTGQTIEQGAPSLFKPSEASQEQGSFRNVIASAFESVGKSLSISAPAVAATALSGGGTVPVMMAYILSTPGVFGAAEYQNFFDESRKAGIPDDVARAPAVLSALAEVGFEAAQNTMEALLVTRGLSRLAAKEMKASMRTGIKALMTPKIREVATDVLASGAVEGVGEGATQAAQEQLRQGVGIDTGPSGVLTAASSGALAGLMFGSVGKSITGLARRSDLRTLASPTADRESRLNAVSQVAQKLKEAPEGDIDPETIAAFTDYATQAVDNQQTIPLNRDVMELISGVRPSSGLPAQPMLPPGVTVQRAIAATPASEEAARAAAASATEVDRARQERAIGVYIGPNGQPIVQGASIPAETVAAATPSTLALPAGPEDAQAIQTQTPGLPEVPANVPPEAISPPAGAVASQATPEVAQQEATVAPAGAASVGQVSPIPPEGAPTQGKTGEYYTPSGNAYPFTYELVEASDAIPSHDPQTFSVNPQYEEASGLPVNVLQDRPYHRDRAEQAKVIEQDRRFAQRYGFLLSDSPDATNGPPIIPADSNVVLGGNSRMMTILRKASEQNPEAYQGYRTALKERAPQYGLDPAQIDQMQAPILVRRLQHVAGDDPQAMQTAARETNENFQQALSEKAQAVSSGKALSDQTIGFLSQQLDTIGEDATLRDVFRTAAGRELVHHLQTDGVVTQRTINKYTGTDGTLNEDGKNLVERAILGRVLPDSDLIDAAPPSTINTLIKSLPAITQLQARGELWDVSRQIRDAVRLATDTKLNGWRSIGQQLKQQSLFGQSTSNPIAIALATQLLEEKPTSTARAFNRFAAEANRDVAGQTTFQFTPAKPPWTAFNQAFKAALTPEIYREAMAVDGRYTAPPESMQFSAKAKTQAQGGGQPWTLSTEEVQSAFPGRDVQQIPGGGYRVQTPAGYLDLVEVDQIQMGPQEKIAFEVGYGQPYHDDVSATGRVVHQAGQSRIELVKGDANRVTLDHEIEHFLEHAGLLTPEEIQQITEATKRDGKEGTAEHRAEWMAGQLNERRYRRDSVVGRILEKVWDTLDRLLQLVGIQTERGIVRQVESGQVLNRADSRTDSVFASMSGQVQQFAVYQRPASVEKENKLYSDYLSWANMVGPELTKLFQENKISFLKKRISVSTMNDLSKQVAESWIENPSRPLKLLDEFRLHQRIPSTEEVGAFTMLGESLADAILEQRRAGGLTDNQYMDLIEKHVGPNSIFASLVGFRSEIGRTFRMSQEKSPTHRFFEQMVDRRKRLGESLTEQQIKDYEAAFNKVLLEGNPESLAKFLGQMETENPTIWSYAKEYWYGSVMSGISTNVANFGNNTMWSFFNKSVLAGLEGMLDPFIARVQNRPTQRFMSEVFPALAGLTRGLTNVERYKQLIPGLKTGDFNVEGMTDIGKFERDMGQYGSVWQHATWQLDFPVMRKLGLDVGKTRRWLKNAFDIEPGKPIQAMRTLAPWVSMATRAMTGMDLIGKAAVYDAHIATMAERQVQTELRDGTLRTDQAASRRTELIFKANDPADAMGRDWSAEAKAEANKLTFNDETSAVGKWIMQGRRIPFLGKPFHLLMPFVGTPDRLLSRAIELVPGLGLIPYRDVLVNYKTSGTDLTALMARQAAGLIMFTMVTALFNAGKVTGDVPEDPNEREAFYRQGLQPWSINLGGYSISYRRTEPLNMVLGAAPALISAIKRFRDKGQEEDVLSTLAYGGAVMAHHVLDGSYFSGIQGFFDAIGRGGQSGHKTESLVTRMVDSWIPYAGMRRNIVRAVDAWETDHGAVIRSPQSFLENITGASLVTNVRVRHDTWGRPIVVPGSVASQFIPWRVSAVSRDPAEQELARYKIFPGLPSQQDRTGKKLDQSAYDTLVQIGGQLAKANLDRLVRQPFYQTLSPELRELYLRRAIRDAREHARDEVQRRQRAQGLVTGRAG